jgi:hypothetical protein
LAVRRGHQRQQHRFDEVAVRNSMDKWRGDK